jgi:hypothetical protein
MKVKAIQLTFIIVAIVSLSSFCLADGCFIPEAKKKIPSIPIQRALVKYQNGIETLIVQSTLNGEGQNFGWIMPVPAEPYKFEKISTGLLKTLSLQLQPKIHQVKPSMKVLGIKAIDIFVILMALTSFFQFWDILRPPLAVSYLWFSHFLPFLILLLINPATDLTP